LSNDLNGSAKEGNMRFGESFGEACRNCGSTEIVVWPPSSAGHCAVCSEAVQAWKARTDQLAERKLARVRAAYFAAEAERHAVERAERWAARRAAAADAGRALAQRGLALGTCGLRRHTTVSLRETRALLAAASRARRLFRAPPIRSRTAHNY
jgi:hypothetical protein